MKRLVFLVTVVVALFFAQGVFAACEDDVQIRWEMTEKITCDNPQGTTPCYTDRELQIEVIKPNANTKGKGNKTRNCMYEVKLYNPEGELIAPVNQVQMTQKRPDSSTYYYGVLEEETSSVFFRVSLDEIWASADAPFTVKVNRKVVEEIHVTIPLGSFDLFSVEKSSNEGFMVVKYRYFTTSGTMPSFPEPDYHWRIAIKDGSGNIIREYDAVHDVSLGYDVPILILEFPEVDFPDYFTGLDKTTMVYLPDSPGLGVMEKKIVYQAMVP